MKFSIATFVILVGGGVGMSAQATTTFVPAHEHEDARTVIVRYRDLNVDTAKGAAQLYRRINYAAYKVCGDAGEPAAGTLTRAYRLCRQSAVEEAVATVDRPKLTALFDRYFPGSSLARVS